MTKRNLVASLLLLLALVCACNRSEPAPAPDAKAATATPAAPAGIDNEGMDTSVVPGDDFNEYVNGTWLKKTEIPPDKSSYGPGNILADQTRKQNQDLIQGAAGAASASADARKVGDFYSSFMDEAAIESKGLAPLKPKLDEIAAIKDKAGLTRVIGGNIRADVDLFFTATATTENLMGVFVSQ